MQNKFCTPIRQKQNLFDFLECKIHFASFLRSKFILRLLECLLFCEGLIEIMTFFWECAH
ncbi:MAG: hypothetical protein DRR00_23145 [Candidatus Parabeggiatoa sp. nov. 3]|nr:MAG: hypothetical protein DRR00_23145 [Gammaproteobacteria bacterium]